MSLRYKVYFYLKVFGILKKRFLIVYFKLKEKEHTQNFFISTVSTTKKTQKDELHYIYVKYC